MPSAIQTNQIATPRATQIARIIQKRRPLAQKIETVENNLRTLSIALRQLENQRDQVLSKVSDSSTRSQDSERLIAL